MPEIGGESGGSEITGTSDVPGLDAALASKLAAPVAQSDVTGLVAALAAKQPLHAILTALAGLAVSSGKLPYGTGSNAFSTTDLTAAGRALLDDADAGAQLTTLGVSAFIKTLLDDVDMTAAKATLGISASSGPGTSGALYLNANFR